VSDLARAHSDALAHLRGGGESATFNAGYSQGYSVFEVINTVKKVSGVDFKVALADRRPGDPTQIVAASEKIRTTLGWEPHYNDLGLIVTHALAWEKKLMQMRN
jgi:UDP-glucose 4-epimerase